MELTLMLECEKININVDLVLCTLNFSQSYIKPVVQKYLLQYFSKYVSKITHNI